MTESCGSGLKNNARFAKQERGAELKPGMKGCLNHQSDGLMLLNASWRLAQDLSPILRQRLSQQVIKFFAHEVLQVASSS